MGEGIEIGSSIGHYRIVSKIGAGGMGEVFEAQTDDTSLAGQRPFGGKFLEE